MQDDHPQQFNINIVANNLAFIKVTHFSRLKILCKSFQKVVDLL